MNEETNMEMPKEELDQNVEQVDNNEPEKIVLEDVEGNKMECDLLYEFTSEETKKHYIIYTANKEDDKGNVAVYSSIVDESSEHPTLKPLEDEKDSEIIKGVLEDIMKSAEEAE